MIARWIGVASVALLAAGNARAQNRPPAGPDSATRRALALAYLRVELANRDRPIVADRLGALNQAFDRTTLAFFGGKYPSVVASLDSVAAAIETDTTIAAAHRTEAARILDHPAGVLRTVSMPDGASFPYRLYVPPKAGPNAPIVVALHGAGTNEAAFMGAYGAGKLRLLADKLGFVLVTPFTNGIMVSADRFDRLVDDVAGAAKFDRAHLYLMGHSLGAMTAFKFAQERSAAIKAVVCLAGASPVSATTDKAAALPRTLVIGAELDLLVPPARLKPAVDQAHAIGWRVEYRELAGQGHTLMVGAALDQAMDFFFKP